MCPSVGSLHRRKRRQRVIFHVLSMMPYDASAEATNPTETLLPGVPGAGGHLMQHGLVDMVIVGADRVTYTGAAVSDS